MTDTLDSPDNGTAAGGERIRPPGRENRTVPQLPSPGKRMLAWYDRHRRSLPWRAPPGVAADPYHVWLSEIMLQQTTVKAVAPYFDAFVTAWPRVEALAAVPREKLLQAWAGLGYYARARNLHACAEVVATRHGGRFPDTEEGLRALPGIGPYTAAAIAAIAFDRPVVPLDGNIERVAARYFLVSEPLREAKPRLRELAQGFLAGERPGDLAQALMDLGATICTPKRPACALCPLAEDCEARRLGLTEQLPVKSRRADKPKRRAVAFWLQRGDGKLLLRRRPDKGLLGGMSEIPTSPFTARSEAERPAEWAPAELKWRELAGEVRHVFTHFELTVTVHAAKLPAGATLRHEADPDRCRWVAPQDLPGEALPAVMRKVAAHALKAAGEGDLARRVATVAAKRERVKG